MDEHHKWLFAWVLEPWTLVLIFAQQIGGRILLEEVWHWEWVLRFKKLKPGLMSYSLFLLPAKLDLNLSAPHLHHVCLHTAMLPVMVAMGTKP